MTLNKHWGYNKNDNDWKDARTIVRNLVDVASKGGNYLLNVGPTAEGIIPDESANILKEVGQWLKTNGESIYGSESGPSQANIRLKVDGCMTRKPGILFLHVFNWPESRIIFMEGMKGKIVKKIYLLADPTKKPLNFDAHERSLFIHVPQTAPSQYDSVIVVELDKSEPLEENTEEPLVMG